LGNSLAGGATATVKVTLEWSSLGMLEKQPLRKRKRRKEVRLRGG
jgi:hypothetical protein